MGQVTFRERYIEVVVSLATVGIAAVIDLLTLSLARPQMMQEDPTRLWTQVFSIHFDLVLVALGLLLIAEFLADKRFGWLWFGWIIVTFAFLGATAVFPETEN